MVILLYGLKGFGVAWEVATQQVMRDLEFQPYMNYADVCMRSAVETFSIDSGDITLNSSSINLPTEER